MKNLKLLSTILLVGFFFLLQSTSSCEQKPPEKSLVSQAAKGEVIYQKQCAHCHDSRNIEETIADLGAVPPDLRTIVSRRGVAEFPVTEIAMIIDGRQEMSGHGTREMPVWGEIYSENDGLDEDQIQGRKAELIAYLMLNQSHD